MENHVAEDTVFFEPQFITKNTVCGRHSTRPEGGQCCGGSRGADRGDWADTSLCHDLAPEFW